MIVAIDTSSSVTVMGAGDSGGSRASAAADGARRHAEVIDVMFAKTVAPVVDDVQAVAVGIGPGPYSGLRVGIAFGIGLGRAWNIPVVGVCSLDARAWQVHAAADTGVESGTEFTVTADARRREVYWARYRVAARHDSGVARTAGPFVGGELPREMVFDDVQIDAGALASRVARLLADGHEPQSVNEDFVPHGADAAGYTLGTGPLFTPSPLYLRQPDVTIAGGAA